MALFQTGFAQSTVRIRTLIDFHLITDHGNRFKFVAGKGPCGQLSIDTVCVVSLHGLHDVAEGRFPSSFETCEETVPFEKRAAEASRLPDWDFALSKYPDRVPVICEKDIHAPRTNLPEIEKSLGLNQSVCTADCGVPLCGEFKYIVHKHIQQAANGTGLAADQDRTELSSYMSLPDTVGTNISFYAQSREGVGGDHATLATAACVLFETTRLVVAFTRFASRPPCNPNLARTTALSSWSFEMKTPCI
ncbi:Autophagy-related protein 8 [Symbiodinium microadriaticum]|uniref:Autophagy-related protein 8 n=1 Tax=Symbiodinium microadriaticum TaxID=2951 RepID=A0A1Q9EYR4_SYMMI|nr:Autophagy-related protein 8 [Symbiodinium microadriaticum]